MSEMRTMADDVDTEERTNGGVIPGLTREARDDRVHVWITPSFTVHSGPNELRGRSLSLEGFEVEDTSAAANIKKAQKFTMRFDVGGFCLEVKVKAEPTAAEPGQSGLVFGFTDIGAGEKDALRRFIRAHISGHVVTADDIIRRQNMPTHVRGSSARNNPRSVPEEEGLPSQLFPPLTEPAAPLFQQAD